MHIDCNKTGFELGFFKRLQSHKLDLRLSVEVFRLWLDKEFPLVFIVLTFGLEVSAIEIGWF